MSNLKEEIFKQLMELIKEGHEAVVNHEEVEEYEDKVRKFISSSLDKQHKADMEEVIRVAESKLENSDFECEEKDVDCRIEKNSIISHNEALLSLINTLKEKV